MSVVVHPDEGVEGRGRKCTTLRWKGKCVSYRGFLSLDHGVVGLRGSWRRRHCMSLTQSIKDCRKVKIVNLDSNRNHPYQIYMEQTNNPSCSSPVGLIVLLIGMTF